MPTERTLLAQAFDEWDSSLESLADRLRDDLAMIEATRSVCRLVSERLLTPQPEGGDSSHAEKEAEGPAQEGAAAEVAAEAGRELQHARDAG